MSLRFKLRFLSLENPTNASTYNFHALLISWIRYFKPRDVIWLVQESFIEFFIVLEGKQRVNICNMPEQVTNSIRYSQIILIDIEEKKHWNYIWSLSYWTDLILRIEFFHIAKKPQKHCSGLRTCSSLSENSIQKLNWVGFNFYIHWFWGYLINFNWNEITKVKFFMAACIRRFFL